VALSPAIPEFSAIPESQKVVTTTRFLVQRKANSMKIERKKNQAANTDRWKEAHTEEEAHSTCDILEISVIFLSYHCHEIWISWGTNQRQT